MTFLPDALGLALLLIGCQQGPAPAAPDLKAPAPAGRDWAAQPAVLELEPPGAIFALSDVHDCGMSPLVGYSEGALLRVTQRAGREVAEALEADGSVRELWRP